MQSSKQGKIIKVNLSDIWQLAGKQNLNIRQAILQDILNKKVVKASAGINNLETVLFDIAGIDKKGFCYAELRDLLSAWIEKL